VSYQEIKRISQGRKLVTILLIFASVFLIFFKKVARAGVTISAPSISASVTSGGWTCSHSPVDITYVINNYVLRGGIKTSLDGTNVGKCEPVYADLTTSGAWGGRLAHNLNGRLCASTAPITGGKHWLGFISGSFSKGYWGVGADCDNINIKKYDNMSAGEIRYVDGEKYSRAQLTGWVSIGTYCDSGFVKGEHAECTYIDYKANRNKATTDWKDEDGSQGGMKNSAVNWWGTGEGPFPYANIESPQIASTEYGHSPPMSSDFPVDLTNWTYKNLPAAACGAACGGGCACGAACGGGACACACDPPADILTCGAHDGISDQDDCLAKSICDKENNLAFCNLNSAGQGKGVVQNPTLANLTPTPESAGSNFTCAGTSCTATATGTYHFTEKTNPANYYGQCIDNGNGVDIKVSGTVPEAYNRDPVTSNPIPVEFNVVNRPPVIDSPISFESSEIKANVEFPAQVTFSDPDCKGDPHADKISHVQWECTGPGICSIKPQGGDTWDEDGTYVENPMNNSYTGQVTLKANMGGTYKLIARAYDNDSPPSSSETSKTFQVSGSAVPVGKMPENCSVISDQSIEKLCTIPGQVTYHAYLDPNDANPAWVAKRQWNCYCQMKDGEATCNDKDWINDIEETHDCLYDTADLSYFIASRQKLIGHENDNWVKNDECSSMAMIQVVGKNSCAIEGKVLGSSKNSSEITAETGDQIQADIEGGCEQGVRYKFDAAGGTPDHQDSENNNFQTSFDPSSSSGYESIKGTMHDPNAIGNQDFDCGEVQVLLKEKLKYR
jgi:hypothetical protein